MRECKSESKDKEEKETNCDHKIYRYEGNNDIKAGDVPNSTTHLTFGYWFNQKIENIPNSVWRLAR